MAAPPDPGLPSAAERHAEQTRQWLVQAAADLLTEDPEAPLVNAVIAQRAGVSERTVYRHYPTRDALLDAVALEAARRLAVPEAPDDLAALPAFVHDLYARFEAHPRLTRAMLKPELFVRMRDGPAARRLARLQAVLDRACPDLPAAERRFAAAHLRYLLSATTWRYYRDHFGFDAADTLRSVQADVAQALGGLGLLHHNPRAKGTRDDHSH